MAIKKYGDAERADVFRGKEATVVNQHIKKLGKAVSDFSEEELNALNKDLEEVQETTSSDKKTSDSNLEEHEDQPQRAGKKKAKKNE